MKTFNYKRKMYLIIFFGLVYNVYLYHKGDSPNRTVNISSAETIINLDHVKLKDSSSIEIIKSLK